MAERIGIEVSLTGADEVINKLRQIDAFGNKLDKKRFKVGNLDPAVRQLDRAMDGLRSKVRSFHRTWQAVNSVDYDRKLQGVNKQLRTMGKQYGEMVRYQRMYNTGAIKASDAQIARHKEILTGYREQIRAANSYRRTLKSLQEFGSRENYQRTMGQFREYAGRIAEARRELNRAFNETPVAGKTLGQTYAAISGNMSRVGASLTTLGNAMTRITSPFSTIMKGAAYTLGYGAVNKITSGLSSGFERYDIMKKYGLTMANFSTKTYDAQKSIDELDKSVRGLPTGLDEIVSMAQRFTMTAGDMKDGTKLAIAANRAFLASMSTDSQRYQGMLQLQDVIGGKKMQSREWASLVASMPFAVREIGKALGYSGKKLDKWVSKVQQGKVANKDFLKGLKKAGGQNGTLKKYADFTKNTWGAFTQNIGNAFSRMTAGMLTSLDGVTKIMTKGKFNSLNSYLADSFIPAIDATTEKIKAWIASNPDKIIGFFDKIRSFDWGGFAKGFASGVGEILDTLGKFSDFLGGDAFKLGQWMVRLNMIGRIVSILGMFTKGLAPFFGVSGVLAKVLAGGGLGRAIGKFAGLFGKLGRIGKAGKAVEGARTIGKVGDAMKSATLSWQGVASKLVGVASIPAAAWSFKEAAEALKILEGVDIDWSSFGKKMGQMATGIGAFLAMAAGVGAGLVALASSQVGWLAIGAGAAGTLTIAGVAELMKTTAQGLDAIAKAEIPDTEQIRNVTDAISDSVKSLGEAGKDLPPDVISNAKKFSGIEGAMASIEAIGRTIPKIAALKLGKKEIEKATESVEAMGPAIDAMKNSIASLFGKKTVSSHETSNGRGRGGKHEVTYQKDFDMKSLKEAAESTSLVQTMMDSIIAIAQGFQNFAKEMNNLKKMGDVNSISEIGQNIGLMVDEIGHIAFRMNTAMGQFKSIEEAPAKFAKLNETLQEFPKIIESIRKIGEVSSGDNAIDIDAVFQPITQGLTRAINSMTSLLPQVEAMRMLGLNLKMAVDSIRNAFNGLNEIATIDVSGAINGITNAIAQINGTRIDVSPLVNKMNRATSRIKAAWARLLGAYNAIKSKSKSITISVSVDVSGAVANLNSAASRLRAAWNNLNSAKDGGGGGGTVNPVVGAATGGYINGKGRPIYRAKGGGVWMEPKGTDTVPAMLTPGEYVQRKKAVDYFGVGFMQKINHLDLEGAIRSLSVRASRALSPTLTQSVTNHIDNRQNNARVNQTIYTNNQNYTFRRANRFVGAL